MSSPTLCLKCVLLIKQGRDLVHGLCWWENGDDAIPGAADTLAAARGLGREVAEDVGKHII